MSSGQWADFTTGNMALTLIDAGSGHSVVEYCARGHWDPVHKIAHFWGQGHNSNTKLLTWDDATNSWTATQDVPYAYAGANIGHAYYHQALDPVTGDLYLRRYGSGTVHKKPYGGAWTTAASHGNLYNQVAGGLEWFGALNSGAGGLVFIDVGSAQSSNAAVTSWTTRQDPLSPNLGAYHNWIAKAGSYCYFGGGNGSTTMFKMNSSGTVTSAPSTPYSAGIWANAGESPVVSHPNGSDLLLFGGNPTTGDIQRYVEGSGWSSIGTMNIGSGYANWFCIPISDYGVVMFVAQTSNVTEPIVRVYKP